jgi:hypothetical protein
MGIIIKDYAAITQDLAVGDTVRVNHDRCPAGEDTRRRLYLTRTQANPEVVVAYCHNCQSGGFMKDGKHEAYRDAKHKGSRRQTITQVTTDLLPPPMLISMLDHWPTAAQAWAFKNKLDQLLVDKYGLAYDVSTDRVYIPRHRWVVNGRFGDLNGYQLRNVEPSKYQPKYLTVLHERDLGFTEIGCERKSADYKVCVIVEDYISGLHLVEACQQAPSQPFVLVNYGTKLNYSVMIMSRTKQIGWNALCVS